MNNSDKPDVYIKREGKIWRWGQDSYFFRWSGLKKSLNHVAVRAMAVPAALACVAITYFSSTEHSLFDEDLVEIHTPDPDKENFIKDLPIIQTSLTYTHNTNLPSRPIPKISVVNLRSLVNIPVGSEAKARLVSGASNGIVKATLVTDLLVDGEAALPEGTTIFGYGRSTEERLYIEFKKAIFPSGETYAIQGQGFDSEDKILGLKGSFVGTRTKKMGLAVGFGMLGGMADGMQTTGGSNFWGQQQKRSVRDSAFSGASKAALDQSQVYLDEMKNSPVIIEVKKGTEFYLIIEDTSQKEENAN